MLDISQIIYSVTSRCPQGLWEWLLWGSAAYWFFGSPLQIGSLLYFCAVEVLLGWYFRVSWYLAGCLYPIDYYLRWNVYRWSSYCTRWSLLQHGWFSVIHSCKKINENYELVCLHKHLLKKKCISRCADQLSSVDIRWWRHFLSSPV